MSSPVRVTRAPIIDSPHHREILRSSLVLLLIVLSVSVRYARSQACATGSPNYPCAYVATSNGITVVDVTAQTALTPQIAITNPTSLVVSPDNSYVWTATGSSNSENSETSSGISLIDATTGTVITSQIPGLNTFFTNASLAISPDGKYLYVSENNAIQVIDTTTRTAKSIASVTINNLTPFGNPQGGAVGGGFAYITDQCTTTPPGGGPSTEACIDVIDTKSSTLTNIIPSGNVIPQDSNNFDQFQNIAIAPGSSTAYVLESSSEGEGFSSSIDILNLAAAQFGDPLFTASSTSIYGLAVAPNGSQVYALIRPASANNAQLYIFDIQSSTQTPVTVGAVASALAVTPDGLYVYVTNSGEGTISVVSTKSKTVIKTIQGIENPQAIAIMQNLPVPWIDQPLSPNIAPANSGEITLTVNGAQFVPSSIVNWNGVALATTYVSHNQVTAVVPTADFAGEGTASVTVTNPGPSGGGASNAVFFSITSPTNNLTFAASSVNAGTQPSAILPGDLNNDHIPDLVVINNPCGATTSCTLIGSITALLGAVNGTFTTNTTNGAGVQPGPALTGDFNGDGKLDLAIVDQCPASEECTTKEILIFLGKGDGTFLEQNGPPTIQPDISGSQTAVLTSGDFNDDGKLDLVIVEANLLYVFLGNGDGSFTSGYSGTVGDGTAAIVTGDFNGDGALDLAALSTTDNTYTILLGNGDGSFSSTTTQIPSPGTPASLVAGDFNNDGKLDLVITTQTNSVATFLGNGDGTFAPPSSELTFGGTLASAIAADLNGDGKLDLAFVNPPPPSAAGIGAAVVFLGNGDGTFQTAISTNVGTNPAALTSSDFNGDGRLDLAAANADGTASILLQSGIPNFNVTDIAFGDQIVGVPSSPRTVTLTNTGSASLAFGPVSITGANNNAFSQTNTCSGTPALLLAPGATCSITVIFTPNAAGAFSATLSLGLNLPGSTLPLSGTGIDQLPQITTQPSSAAINLNQAATLTVAATGTAPLAYQWYLGNSPNTATPITGATNASFTTPPLTATTNYWVQVSNAAGSVNSNTAIITVNQAPVCTVTVQGGSVPLTITATATCSDPQGQSLATTIDWGDGTPTLVGNSGTHTYGASGTYTVTASAANTVGLTANATSSVTVAQPSTGVFPGQSTQVSATIPVQPSTLIGAAVQFTCSSVSVVSGGQVVTTTNLSQFGISCAPVTTTLTASPTQVNVVIQTTGPASSAAATSTGFTGMYALVLPLPGLLFFSPFILKSESRRKLQLQFSALCMLTLLLFITACGGGQFTPPPTPPNHGGGSTVTPAATYYITITDQVLPPTPSTGFVQTSLIVPLPVIQPQQ